jgi:hypothetical protein
MMSKQKIIQRLESLIRNDTRWQENTCYNRAVRECIRVIQEIEENE